MNLNPLNPIVDIRDLPKKCLPPTDRPLVRVLCVARVPSSLRGRGPEPVEQLRLNHLSDNFNTVTIMYSRR